LIPDSGIEIDWSTDNYLFNPSVELDPTAVEQDNADEQHSIATNTAKAYKDLVPSSLLSIQKIGR
jgi:hypothetical protein